MGIGGSFQDAFTERDQDEKKTSIVQDSKSHEDDAEFGYIANHPRALSNTSQCYCCCCHRARKLSSHEEDLGDKISQEDVETQRQRSRSLEIGATVLVRNYGPGTVRFNGETHFAPGIFIGVELDQPFGKHDGFYDGKRYFHARPKTGVFVRERRLGTVSDSAAIQESKKQPQRKYSFALNLNDGLVSIHTSLKENVTNDDCEIIRYRPNRLGPDFDQAKWEVSSSRLDEKFLSVQATDDKASKLDLLLQLLEKEYLRFCPNHRRKASHHRTRSRRKGRSRSLKTSEQLGNHPCEDPSMFSKKHYRETKYDSMPARVLQQTTEKWKLSSAPSVICLAQTSSMLSFPGYAKPRSSSILSAPSDTGVFPHNLPDLRTPTPAVLSSFDSNDNQNNSYSRLEVRHAADKLSIDASTIQDPETDYYSEWSGDDGGQVDLLMQDLEHERLMVKRKEERVRELEEELRGYDRELKEKVKALTRKSRQIERLEKQCEELAEGKFKAETEAQSWQFEVLYGRGEQTMVSLNV